MKPLFVGSTALAREVLLTSQDAFNVSVPPHFKHLLGRDNIGLLNEPEHTVVRLARNRKLPLSGSKSSLPTLAFVTACSFITCQANRAPENIRNPQPRGCRSENTHTKPEKPHETRAV